MIKGAKVSKCLLISLPEVKVLPVIIYFGYPMPMYWLISCSLHLLIDAVFVLYSGLSVNGMMLRVKAKELSTEGRNHGGRTCSSHSVIL